MLEEYYTKVSLTGAKTSVIQMLNTAIRNVEGGNIITPEDGIEDIIAKFHFKDENGYEKWLRFLIHDFLDMECIDNDAMKQRQKTFQDWCKKENIDDNSYDYAVVVVNILDKGDEYEVELSLGEDEYEHLWDWAGWADLTEVYGVKIYVDVYDCGTVEEFYRTTIHEIVDGSLKTTQIVPSFDLKNFFDDFYKLIDLNPQRYKPVLIETLENEIEHLQRIVQDMKLSQIKNSLKENGDQAEIPEGQTEIEGHAEEDADDSWIAWIDEILG